MTEDDASTLANGGSGAPAVERAMLILDFLATRPRGATLSEIAKELRLNKSTCFKILRALTASGAVTKAQVASVYRLGPKLVELGTASRSNLGVRDGISTIIGPLADELNLTCVVSQLLPDHQGAVVLDRVMPSREEARRIGIGHVYPLSLPAIGKAVFAHEELTDSVINRLGFRSKAQIERFKKGVEEARRLGYGVSIKEVNDDVNAVAAVVMGSDGMPAFVLSLSGDADDLPPERLAEVGDRLREFAESLAKKLTAEYDFGPIR